MSSLKKRFTASAAVFGLHGEAIADRDHRDFRLMDLRNQRHIREDIGVAHVIDGGLACGLYDDAARIAEIDRHAVGDVAGGMVGANERHREAALVRGATRVHRVEFLQALGREPHAEIIVGDDRSPRRGRNVERIAHMVAVAVSEHDVGHAFDGCGLVRDEGRIAGEERIDQDCLAGEVESKGGVAIPGDLHAGGSLA